MATLRQITKPPTHYGVFFYCDKSWFSARLSQIACDGIPQKGNDYQVRWTTSHKPALARVVMSGTHSEVNKFLDSNCEKTPDQLEPTTSSIPSSTSTSSTPIPSSTSSTSIPSSTPTSSTPGNMIGKKKTTKTAKDKKKECRVLNTGSPDKRQEELTTCDVVPNGATDNIEKVVCEKLDNFLLEIQRTVDRTSSQLRNQLENINQRVGSLNTKVCDLETSVSTIKRMLDVHVGSVDRSKQTHSEAEQPPVLLSPTSLPQAESHMPPPQSAVEGVTIPGRYEIPMDTLRVILRNSHGPGNFGLKLSEKLFPELFSIDSQRRGYSYNGRAQGKKALDEQRKAVVRHYVVHFYPEYKDKKQYQIIINAINEGLRRPVRKPTPPPSLTEFGDCCMLDTLNSANEVLNGPFTDFTMSGVLL